MATAVVGTGTGGLVTCFADGRSVRGANNLVLVVVGASGGVGVVFAGSGETF